LKIVRVKSVLLCSLAFVASAVMLTVIGPPFGIAWLAWVAWVPFVLACYPGARPKPLVLIAYIVSLCYWLGNLYWIAPVTVIGWLAFCLYTAVLWPMLAFGLRYCRLKKIPLVLAVPVLIVGAERLQGLFLGGFLWRHLSHSQYTNITLIQIADIFGAAGVSFLIAMVNGLVAELIIAAWQKNVFKISNLLKIALVCVLLTSAVVYGRWRVSQSEGAVKAGPLVGSLQSNVPQSVKGTFQQSDIMFAELMEKSKAAAAAGAELVIWPETMVQATIEPAVLRLLDASHSYRVFDRVLSEHAKDTAFILVGAYGGSPEIKEDMTIHLPFRYNSAFLYRPDGQKYPGRYDKIHLVPFGEFIPFKKRLPVLFNLLMKFTPYDYDYSLDAGSEYTVFDMTSGREQQGRTYRFSVMICYEDTVPAIARRFTLDDAGRKRLDWLVNISNDGWFVRFKNGKVFASTELVQHMAVCVFRAVENRLSVVRSVNTGISCLIDSVGRVRDGFAAGDLPHQASRRQGVAGWFVDRVPIDERTTFFSGYGQWLDFCCAIGFVLAIIVPSNSKVKVQSEKLMKKFRSFAFLVLTFDF
jgi:apolipoprotein N-acyltransferase